MKNETKNLLAELKKNDEDFEWYPSTDEIIEKMYEDLIDHIYKEHKLYYDRRVKLNGLLDIGAGDGRVLHMMYDLAGAELEKLKKGQDTKDKDYDWQRHLIFTDVLNLHKKYAIEKSKIHIQNWAKDISILGTDFMEQSLIDKEVDITFSNPPYTEFKYWTEKILKESNSKIIYLVIPERWEEDKILKELIERRKIDYTVVGEFDFLNADRAARAKVHLIRFESSLRYAAPEAFDIFFKDNFHIDFGEDKKNEKIKEHEEKLKNALISKKTMVQQLVLMYTEQLKELLGNYQTLGKINPILLEELGVNIKGIKESLQVKIKGLKNKYWKIVFDQLEALTTKLTKKNRESLLEDLLKRTAIDFTESNIFAVIIYILKCANTFFDAQVLEIYNRFAQIENVVKYKSNQRTVKKDGWRYIKDFSHYTLGKKTKGKGLEYRIVTTSYRTPFINCTHDSVNGLNIDTFNFIQDFITVAINLGFNIDIKQLDIIQWEPGKEFTLCTRDGAEFAKLRIYLNHNIHFKFSKEYMMKLNIEAARLNGWVKSPQDIVDEFEDSYAVTLEEVTALFKTNLQLPISSASLLLECK